MPEHKHLSAAVSQWSNDKLTKFYFMFCSVSYKCIDNTVSIPESQDQVSAPRLDGYTIKT